MKKIISSILLSLTLLAGGCASTQVSDALPYIKTASQIASNVVLHFATHDPEQRQKIQNEMYAVALGIRTLSGGEAPTVADLKLVITEFAPNLAQYADLATPLGSFYADFFPKIQGDTKLAFQVLESIAEGVETAASTVHEPTPFGEPVTPVQ